MKITLLFITLLGVSVANGGHHGGDHGGHHGGDHGGDHGRHHGGDHGRDHEGHHGGHHGGHQGFEGTVEDPEPSTLNKCKCNSNCSTIKFDGFVDDYCEIIDDTCTTSPDREWNEKSYDKCQYLEEDWQDYTKLTWWQKKSWIMGQIEDTKDNTEANYNISGLIQSQKFVFENNWDVMPEGRSKALHAIGAHCPVSLTIESDSIYTGMLEAGKKLEGLLRLSPANFDTENLRIAPTAAIKFFRTNMKSANVVFLKSGFPSTYDFFDTYLPNHSESNFSDQAVKEAIGPMFISRVCSANECANKVGISDLCTHDQDGKASQKLIFPFKLTLVPIAGKVSIPNEQPESFKSYVQKLANAIPEGTELYKVKASMNPDDQNGSILGNLVTEGPCVTSNFGDTKLSFKHQSIQDDVDLKPEWYDAYKQNCLCEGVPTKPE